MDITVFRGEPLQVEARALPADTYNLARLLQLRAPRGVAFVPIRSMQVLAVADAHEIVFLDSQFKSWVMVAWRGFQANDRGALDAPVAFESVCYEDSGFEAMRRLPREFHLALEQLASRQQVDGPSRVVRFTARRGEDGSPTGH